MLYRFSPAHAGNSCGWRVCRLTRQVQPRACGEQLIRRPTWRADSGSAPRMRGTAIRAGSHCCRSRFSPAHAGNRNPCSWACCGPAVQPRACGEQSAEGGAVVTRIGSAPRMRGTGRLRTLNAVAERFSPAHAGNRSPVRRASVVSAVQPRACGEQLNSPAPGSSAVGSAPRMRGTVAPHPADRHDRRFSPAHAGNSLKPRPHLSAGAVQPRACGEQVDVAEVNAVGGGSAPRMRGTGLGIHPLGEFARFSPAHAGNSGLFRSRDCLVPVQPRACGEQSATQGQRILEIGSAPRMRGTGGRPGTARRRLRFSPAHAGNSVPPNYMIFFWPVQPRACGEQQADAATSEPTVQPRACGEQQPQDHRRERQDGSAPRMRGTADTSLVSIGLRRFSPAHAGNSSSMLSS